MGADLDAADRRQPAPAGRAVASTVPDDDRGVVEYAIEDSLDALAPEHRDVIALAAILGVEGRTGDVTRWSAATPRRSSKRWSGRPPPGSSTSSRAVGAPTSWPFTHDLVRAASLGVLTTRTMPAHVRALDLALVDDHPGGVARRAHHAVRPPGAH